MVEEIHKTLSANDVGETGGHQAGILVPKAREILTFFPSLEPSVKNPRALLTIAEFADGTTWVFNFIYYNNRLFGGTRNEYRLTGMTRYLKNTNARPGDKLKFSKDANHSIVIDLQRADARVPRYTPEGALILSGGWVAITS